LSRGSGHGDVLARTRWRPDAGRHHEYRVNELVATERAMTHMQVELARDRQRSLLRDGAAERDLRIARLQSRIVRQARRAEQRQLSHAHQAARLTAQLDQLVSSGEPMAAG
jgi:hypothetical protein